LNLSGADWTPAWLWLAVVASGLYHGVNPGWGGRSPFRPDDGKEFARPGGRALAADGGHLLAMLLVILPFALLVALVEWQRRSRSAPASWSSGSASSGFVNRRHPRALARIRRRNWGFGPSPWRSRMARD
jgi:hypothetical protein